MPLTPAMRPFSAISSTADRPISAPPAAEAIGVKEVAVISGPPAREIDAADLSAIGDKVNGELTLPRNFETEASGFLQPFPVVSPPSARGRRTPVQRRPPVAHGDFADVAELSDTVLVHRASQRDAAATHAASNPLAPLATVNPDAWRALAERAVEPNGYYLPDWALALDASARDRTDSSTICAWRDARLTGLLPVISLWRAYKIPLPALVATEPYGTLCTPLLD